MPSPVVVRTNLAVNGRPTSTLWWQTGSAITSAVVTDGGEPAHEATVATAGVPGSTYTYLPPVSLTPPPGVGRWAAVGVDVKPLTAEATASMRVLLRLQNGNTTTEQTILSSPPDGWAAGNWTRAVASVQQASAADNVDVLVWPSGALSVGPAWRTRRVAIAYADTQAAAEAAVAEFFDGSTPTATRPDGSTLVYAWTGAADASPSTETLVPAPITVTPDPANGRMQLEVYGGPPDTALYIFRRSTSGGGVDIVRDTSEGTAGFPELEEEARNLIINPRPRSSVTGWAAPAAGSVLELADGKLRLGIGPSLASSATLRAVPSATEDRWPVTPGQRVRLRVDHGSPASSATTVTTRIVGLNAAGATTETVASDVWSATAGATRAVDIQGTVTNAATVAVRAETVVQRPGAVNAARASSFEDPAELSALIPISSLTFDHSTAWASQGAASMLATVGIPITSNAALQTAMGAPVVGKWYGLAVDLRLNSGVVWARPALVFRNASGGVIGSVVFGTNTQLVAGTTHRLAVQAQVPAGAVRVDHGVYVYSNSTTGQIAAGASWRMDGWMLAANADTQALATSGAATFAPTMLGPVLETEYAMLRVGADAAAVAGSWFDGSSVSSDPARGYDWLGEPNASPSIYGRYVPAVIYDYEPIQGDAVDYILADSDGNQIATTRVVIPRWGTWLKSPGRPSRNLRCLFGKVSGITAPIRREVYDVEQSGQVVVYAARRSSERGAELVLVTRTAQDVDAMRLLLSDGATLMLDVVPEWNVGLRYLAVGDVERTRPLEAADGFQNLQADARLWQLGDVIAQPSPQGATVSDPGRTYAVIPTELATYVAIPATTSTYEALATGEEA